MPDRTQTLSVEKARTQIEALRVYNDEEIASRRCAMEGWVRIDDVLAALSQPEHQGDEKVTRTGHEIGAIYEKCSLSCGAYLVLGETDSGEVEVEQVVKGTGGKHFVVGDRWTHRTHVDHTDRKIGYAQPPAPVLSDEERERLEDIATRLARFAGRAYPDVEFLRNLASQEHRGEENERIARAVKRPQTAWPDGRHGPKVLYVCTDRECGNTSVGCPPADCRDKHISKKVLVVPEPPAGEAERLRERRVDALVEAGRMVLGSQGPQSAAVAAEALDKALAPFEPPPSDPQGDQERCERCDETGNIWPRGYYAKPELCPDCNPAPTQVEGDQLLRRAAEELDRRRVQCKIADDVREFSLGKLASDLVRIASEEEPEQPEGGDEEDWPEVIMARIGPGRNLYIADDVDLSGTDQEAHPYVPAALPAAVPSDPSVLEREKHKAIECAGDLSVELRRERDRANKAEAERDQLQRDLDSLNDLREGEMEVVVETRERAERAETALEELAENFDQRAEVAREDVARKRWEHAASLAREKAAKLKEGEQ